MAAVQASVLPAYRATALLGAYSKESRVSCVHLVCGRCSPFCPDPLQACVQAVQGVSHQQCFVNVKHKH
jgi:hypothetical protein